MKELLNCLGYREMIREKVGILGTNSNRNVKDLGKYNILFFY